MGPGRFTSISITHTYLHNPNNKLVNAKLEHFWCMNEPRANLDSKDPSRSRLGGSHFLPPYSILCVQPWGQHPNGILSRDSQVGVPKFPKLGLPWLWGPITLCSDLRLRWGLKQNCRPCQELSNSIWHATYTQGNRGQFLVVGNQTANLTLGPSFGHNLCF
jgi:hypothetical protein